MPDPLWVRDRRTYPFATARYRHPERIPGDGSDMLGWSNARIRRRGRLAFLGGILLLVAPALVSGLTHGGDAPTGDVTEADNVTFVGVQGPFGPAGDGRVVAIDTGSREIVWEYANRSADENVLYYDIDPLSEDRVLFVEERSGRDVAAAIVVNWRTDELVERFPVPSDTHDVDHLGGDRYAVADKYNHRAYVYDAGDAEVVWEYNFSDHFPPYPEAGEAPASEPSGVGGYTHLNDIDAVDDGSAFLLSPRNFDRVVLVDRSTKEVEWVLGGQDDHDVLHAQHNPTLLSREPPVVLVADSENDRVVEYRRHEDGTWELTWEYRGDLVWPRDADRLPNGNTLIVDTRGQRVIEVTPGGDIVWERAVSTMPYDVERFRFGDEPAGPPIESAGDGDRNGGGDGGVPAPRELYTLALWVIPPWIGFLDFYGLLAAGLVALVWGGVELATRLGFGLGR